MTREELIKEKTLQLKEEIGMALSTEECISFVTSVLNLYDRKVKTINTYTCPHCGICFYGAGVSKNAMLFLCLKCGNGIII